VCVSRRQWSTSEHRVGPPFLQPFFRQFPTESADIPVFYGCRLFFSPLLQKAQFLSAFSKPGFLTSPTGRRAFFP